MLHLEDGSTITAKVNFATIYHMYECDRTPRGKKIQGTSCMDLMKRVENLEKSKKAVPEELQMQLAAKVVYAILRSNNVRVDFDEALVLTPIDVGEGSEFDALLQEFKEKLDDFKKKQEARQKTKEFLEQK